MKNILILFFICSMGFAQQQKVFKIKSYFKVVLYKNDSTVGRCDLVKDSLKIEATLKKQKERFLKSQKR